MSLKLITGPTVEPVTLAEVKTNSRVPGSADDTLLNTLIEAARVYTENYLGRSLVQQTWDLFLDNFPPTDSIPIIVPLPPLISVSYIKYWDTADIEQTWSSAKYTVDVNTFEGQIYPAINEAWPLTRDYPNAVNVRFVAGYSDSGASPPDLTDNIPRTIKQAILLLVGHFYENREASLPNQFQVSQIPLGYAALLSDYRVRKF